jgi:hypothetical protein
VSPDGHLLLLKSKGAEEGIEEEKKERKAKE